MSRPRSIRRMAPKCYFWEMTVPCRRAFAPVIPNPAAKSHGERKSERPHDAAKANVASRRVDRLGLARRWPVAQAVVGRAQVRAAFHHPAGGVSAGRSPHLAGLSGYFATGRCEAPLGPLPHIPDHVVEAIAVCGKGVDRRGAFVAVELEVLPGETALPRVGHRPPLRSKRFAPGVGRAVETAARGEFPFGLDGQFFAGPGGVGARILVGDVNHGVVIPTLDAAARTLRMLPIRPGDIFPPGPIIAQIHWDMRLTKQRRAGNPGPAE